MNKSLTEGQVILETKLPLPLVSRGKVRDIYAVGDDKLLMITSDRLSAFDVVMSTPIPDKGCVLNQISLFWFKKLEKVISNPVITDDIHKMGFDAKFIKDFVHILTGRSVLVYRAKPLPVECVVRGFLVGSGWKDYQKTGKVCGHMLPKGLKQCAELPEPIFTPSTKATVGHDMNISFEDVVGLIGKEMATQVRDLSLRLYKEGVAFAKTKGILIADTKFELGIYKDQLVLIDEVLTPDSSRFWSIEAYRTGQDQPSLDKQVVRDYLETLSWDKTPPGPILPAEIVEKTSTAYKNVFYQLTGRQLT
jgi:phosphoribosylaminoimidazole-succinocarboxamide synthase